MQIKKCEQEIIKFGVWLTGHEQKDIEQMLNDYNNYKDNESNLVEARVMQKIADIKKEFEEKFHPLLTDDRLVYSNTSIRDLWIWFELKIKSNFSV